jgi:hypothetical protein
MPYTLMAEPNLAKDLRENVLPDLKKSSADIPEPRLHIPKTLIVDPMRANPRRDILLP